MSVDPAELNAVNRLTEVVRAPKRALATFGSTAIDYYLLSEPLYGELGFASTETVLRTGKVLAERPQIVTPYYLLNLFRGFAHGQEYARYLIDQHGPGAPGLMYSYRNELHDTSVLADPIDVVCGRIAADLDSSGRHLAAVIRGVDHLWDVSLAKFIYELTVSSVSHNVADLGQRGLLGEDEGMPRAARARIEEMFQAVRRQSLDASILKEELDRWGVFEEYEDRFFDLFRKP